MKSITGKLAFAYSTIQKMEDRITELESANAELLDALKELFDDFKSLADSGDAGFWKLENQPSGKKAIAAMTKHGGEN